MENANSAVCQGCGCSMDISGVSPFALCECENCGTRLIIPLIMGHLQLEKHVGEIRYLDIYEGYDTATNNDVIIYVLKKDIDDFERWLTVATDEAAALETLRHANICPLFEHGVLDGTFFCTTPIMDGGDLTQYDPRTHGLLEVDSVINLMQVIALAMGVAHHKEFTHHDICPQNIHIDGRGTIRVKNLFVSRFRYMVENELELESTVSPFYITPERAQKKPEDKKSDVFSFGVLFYYYLTGTYPFEGDNIVETIHTRVKKQRAESTEVYTATQRTLTAENVDFKPPQPPHVVRSDIPEDVSRLVFGMLTPYQVQRPKFSEIITEINLAKAAAEQRKLAVERRGIVRIPTSNDGLVTKTRAIPIMRNLGEDPKKSTSFKRKFFK